MVNMDVITSRLRKVVSLRRGKDQGGRVNGTAVAGDYDGRGSDEGEGSSSSSDSKVNSHGQSQLPGSSLPDMAVVTTHSTTANTTAQAGMASVQATHDGQGWHGEQQQLQVIDAGTVRNIVGEEVKHVMKDVTALRSDMESLKSGLSEFVSTVENALVDIRAFHAETINPVNFMRKYIDEDEGGDSGSGSGGGSNSNSNNSGVASNGSVGGSSNSSSTGNDGQRVTESAGNPGTGGNDAGHETGMMRHGSHNGDGNDSSSSGSICDDDNDNNDNDRRDSHSGSGVSGGSSQEVHAVTNSSGLQQQQQSQVGHASITTGRMINVLMAVDEALALTGQAGVEVLLNQYVRSGKMSEHDVMTVYSLLGLVSRVQAGPGGDHVGGTAGSQPSAVTGIDIVTGDTKRLGRLEYAIDLIYNMGNALGAITDYDRLQYMRAKLTLREMKAGVRSPGWVI